VLLDLSRRIFSKYKIFIFVLIYYSRYLWSKLCIDIRDRVNCVI